MGDSGPLEWMEWTYAGCVAAPRRKAAWGTRDSVLEDLRLARDAGGLARAGVDRLEGSLRLRFETGSPEPGQLKQVRDWLAGHVTRGCAAYRVLHSGDPCAQAAATSAEAILLAEPDNGATAASLRKAAIDQHGCFIAVDSLRKRELAVLELIADAAYGDTEGDNDELFLNVDSILRVLRPYAELAALTVADAAKLFSQRAALEDDTILGRAVAHAVWAVAQFGVLPVYGLDRLHALGMPGFPEESIEYLLEGVIRVPFVSQPDDIYQLSTAIQIGEEPETFYGRLLDTPVMRPVIERFVIWIAGHDPKVCLFDSNDVMVRYCRPHYYAAL